MKQKFKFDEKSGTMVPDGVPVSKPQKKIEEAPPSANSASIIEGEKTEHNIPVNEGVVQFREQSDLTVFQIIDSQTGTILGYISGYALDINFNMQELRSTDRVEQFLDGIKKMFREAILEKAFSAQK